MRNTQTFDPSDSDLKADSSLSTTPLPSAIDIQAARRTALEYLPDVVIVLDRDWKILFANDVTPGMKQGPALGKSIFDCTPESWHQTMHDSLVQAMSSSAANRFEVEVYGPGIRSTHLECRIRGTGQKDGTAAAVLCFSDIGARRASESDMRLDADRYRFLTEAISDIIWTMDLEQRITSVSASIKPVVGYEVEEFQSMALSELLAPESFALARETLLEELRLDADPNQTSSRIRTLDLQLIRRDGSTLWCEARMSLLRDGRGRPSGILGVARDISSWREAQEALVESEEKLQRAQRLEAVGQLAGGIAHDFNNLLTVIIGNVELMLKELPPGDLLVSHADEVSKAADRAASLTRQLLAFSRKQMMVPKVLDLNNVVREMATMLKGLLGENIEVETSLCPALGQVKVDPNQIELALVNLAVNARDAMAEGGKLVIETANAHLEPSHGGNDFTVVEGPYIMLAVTDSGKGIEQEEQEKIFEPFFTTKEVGKGTGLGLSTVYGIVKQSDGYVWLHSRPGKGARFEIYLPRIEGEQAREALPLQAEQHAMGTENILLVEDEPSVRSLTKRILKSKGYHVDEAPCGDKALEILGDEAPEYDLLLTDVIMPGISGATLAHRAVELRPGLRVLFISGHSDDMLTRHGRLESPSNFLEKPFTSDGLSRKIREVLDAAQDPATP
jgi:PAS domain S-box-containing protein